MSGNVLLLTPACNLLANIKQNQGPFSKKVAKSHTIAFDINAFIGGVRML